MRKFLRRLNALLHRRRLQRELAGEMAAHLEMMPAGRRPNFGSTLRLQEEAAGQWGFAWLDQLHQDVAYGLRGFRRSPGFALTAIAVLSLGIGVNLAEIHFFDAFLHQLNVRDIRSLCRFYRVTRQGTSAGFPIPEIEFYRRHNTALSAVIAETMVFGISQGQDNFDLRLSMVSGNFFDALGIAPIYGRMLNEQDDQPGAPPVAVLGYDYWHNRFGGDPAIVTRTIRLNDKPVEVVGIAPPEFGGLIQTNVYIWMPAAHSFYLTGDARLLDYSTARTAMVGRLKPGVGRQATQEQFRALTAALRASQPREVDPGEWLKVQPVEIPVKTNPAAVLLMGTIILLVLLVLFSACANLGNMLLARGLSRRREIEIRLAIGAGRARLVRQLMTENLLLAALAAVASLLVGRVAAAILLRITEAPSHIRMVTNWRIVLSCAALALLATLAFGLAPALQIARRGPQATRARQILVSVQVAASCVLLILSTFLARAVEHSFRVEAAFDYTRLAAVDPAFYLHNYTPSRAWQSALDMAARLRQVPGIDAASIVTIPPLRRPGVVHSSGQVFYLNRVDPSYFSLMRLPLVDGRIFGPSDQDSMVISESAARKLWPNQSPLGKTFLVDQRTRTVAGVVKDSGVNLVTDPESVEVYLPIVGQQAVYVEILVRSTSSPAPLLAALKSAATIPGIVPTAFTIQSQVDNRLDTMRKMVAIVSSLAAISSLLALLGIFGLLAFTVAQRTREIGVRMALGARGLDILEIVLGQYALPFGMGVAAGIAIAAAAAHVLRTLLYGFARFDLLSFAAGLVLFAAVAFAAAIVPARRALRIQPASALRYE